MPKREDEFWARQKELKEQESLRGDRGLDDEADHREEIEEENGEEEQENIDTRQNAVPSLKSKAWFGNEYYDKKTRKWKKPGTKTRSIIASIVLLAIIVVVIALILLYIFVLAKPVS